MKNFPITSTSFLLPSLQTVESIRPVEENRVAEVLDCFKLNWEVAKEPLFLGDNTQTDFFGVVRQDTRKAFQACKATYNPFQNSQVVELALTVADALNTTITSCKTLYDGAILYIVIKGRDFRVNAKKVGDVVNEQIVISNSHDGRSALRISFGHVVLSCTNGMTRFDKLGSFSIRHTDSMKRKLERAIAGISQITTESSKMVETYHRLADMPINTKQMQTVLGLATGYDMDAPADELSTVGEKILGEALSSLTTEMSYKGRNGWGLLNGVTHYTTKLAGESDSRAKSKMFGEMAKREMNVWEYLTSTLN